MKTLKLTQAVLVVLWAVCVIVLACCGVPVGSHIATAPTIDADDE